MKKENKQDWKKCLEFVCDNPDYIEQQIESINEELTKNLVDTDRIRTYAKKIIEWANEIDLAYSRTKLKDIRGE